MTYIVGRHCENTPALPHFSSSISLAVQPQQLHMHTWKAQTETLLEQVALKTADRSMNYLEKLDIVSGQTHCC